MASISGVGEFFRGPSEEDDALSEKYKPWMQLDSGVSPIDPVPTDPPMGARLIKLLETTGSCSKFLVSGLIRVYAPSDAFRQSMVNAWSHQRTLLNRVTWIGFVGCVVLGKIAAAPPIYFIATIAALFFARYRTSQADAQVKLWGNSPAAAVAEQRAIAYKEGFPYVYANQLKLPYASSSETAVLHPTEVQMLYEKYFPAFCNTMLDWNVDDNCSAVMKGKWVHAFLKDNPLDLAWMKYAYGEDLVPHSLTSLSLGFAELNPYLGGLQNQYEAQRQKAIAAADWEIEKINANPFFSSGRDISRIKQKLESELQQIENREMISLSTRYAAARELIQRAKDVWNS